MCVHMQTVTGFSSPFPPSNSFFTESLGSGTVCGDDTLAAGGLALLWSRVWRMRQSSSRFSRSFQYSASRERASQESVRASASAPKAVWENLEKISCSHSGQYVCFHFIFWGSNPCTPLHMLGKCSNTEPHSSCLAKTLNSINLNESNKQQRRNFIDLILDWRRWIRGTFRRGPVVISQVQSVCILKSLLVSDKQGLLCLGQ